MRALIPYMVLSPVIPGVSDFLLRGDLFESTNESAHYVLSALVQSEAAIIAVVVTLSLVAVQLTSFYSQRVTDLFRKSPHLLILMAIYISSMVYDVIILKTIGIVALQNKQDVRVNFACALGIYCLIILIPYLYAILGMLRPPVIVESLMWEMTVKSFLKKEKPFEDIRNVLRRCLERSDFQGAKECLESIGTEMQRLLYAESIPQVKERLIAERISTGIREICDLLMKPLGYPSEIIRFLSEIISTAMRVRIPILAQQLMPVFDSAIGYTSQDSQRGAVNFGISELKYIFTIADSYDCLDVAKETTGIFWKIARQSLVRYEENKKKEPTLPFLISSRRMQYRKAAENEHGIVEDIVSILGAIKKKARNEDIRIFAADKLEDIRLFLPEEK